MTELHNGRLDVTKPLRVCCICSPFCAGGDADELSFRYGRSSEGEFTGMNSIYCIPDVRVVSHW